MYVLAIAGLSFVTSFIMLSQMFTGDRNSTDGLASEDFTRLVILALPVGVQKTFSDPAFQ